MPGVGGGGIGLSGVQKVTIALLHILGVGFSYWGKILGDRFAPC